MYVKMSGGFKKMNDRESKRLEESIDKIKIAIEYSGRVLRILVCIFVVYLPYRIVPYTLCSITDFLCED